MSESLDALIAGGVYGIIVVLLAIYWEVLGIRKK